jgi:hypothetical protein
MYFPCLHSRNAVTLIILARSENHEIFRCAVLLHPAAGEYSAMFTCMWNVDVVNVIKDSGWPEGVGLPAGERG